MYTPNVEGLLETLNAPLEVVHNVAPAEVRAHLDRWRQAAETEVKSLETLGAIKRIRGREAKELLHDGTVEIVPAKAVCTVKPGSPYKRKMRVVSCGNYATGTDEASLYAGGAGAESLRALLVHGGRRGRRCFCTDIKTAFLLAPIPAHVTRRYAVKPPRVLVELNICEASELWLIQKALYGFRESPKWWATHRDSILRTAQWQSGGEEFQLRQLKSENNIWAIEAKGGGCAGHLLIYVDDFLFVTDESIARDLVGWIRGRWECTDLSVATEDDPLKFLGVDVYEVRDSHGIIGFRLGQQGYIDELLRSHGVEPNTPVPREWVREMPAAEQFSDADLRSAQKVTGELLWVAQRTRPDLGFCVGLMSSWTTKAPRHVLKIGLRALQFLAATRDQRLSLVPGRPNGMSIYSDASFAPFGGHSISGILIQYDEVGIVWKSRKQTLVTLSTAEAELVAACEAVVLTQSLSALVDELEGVSTSKRLLVDNVAAITLAEGGGSPRTRHLHVRAGFLQEMLEHGDLTVEHCPGEEQLADCLTKALPKPRTDMLSRLIGLGPDPIGGSVAQVKPTPVSGTEDSMPQLCRVPGVPLQARLGLLVTLLLLQAELGEATDGGSEESAEPLSVELSLLLVMMTLAVLFVWESSKQCVRACCARRADDDFRVRTVMTDEDGVLDRRGRRQQAVRRAIEREVQDEGLRQRRPMEEREHGTSGLSSYVHVTVDAPASSSRSVPDPPVASPINATPPPPPPLPGLGSGGPSVREPPPSPCPSSINQPLSTAHGSTSSPPVPNHGLQRLSQSELQGARPGVRRDASTQTDRERGFDFQELCELHVITTTGRGPGALHLFPGCHALRNSTTHQRMFCRYCLQAARDARRNQSSIL